MSEWFLPAITHVLRMTVIRRERVLPAPGAITVRVNEKVQAADVVGEAEVQARHYYLDVARGLGVPAAQAAKLIRCREGERVEMGDVIAGPVGVARRSVRAPADGMVVVIRKCRVLLEARGEVVQVRAGFPGVVIATDGSQVVTLEATGALVQGMWGNARQDYGVMRVVSEGPSGSLQTDQLDVNLRGAVLVAGTCDHSAPLHQATELSVRGVIMGSMSSDLIPVARRLPFPIMLTEGFGRRPMNAPAFQLFTSNVGREVAVDAGTPWAQPGQRPEAIIPLPASRTLDLPEEVVPLKAGVRVRVVREPHLGEVGVVKSILKEAMLYPSGIRARSVEIEIEGVGSARVPMDNVEILQ